MIYTGLKVKLEPKDFKRVMKKTFDKLNSFPSSIWTPIQQDVMASNRAISVHIVRFSVSNKTKKWRKSRAKKGKTVETYNGQFNQVLDSPRVGRRTATFIDAYRNSKAPAVVIRTSTVDSGYANPIENGHFEIIIDPTVFSRNYPLYFQKYLQRRGILDSNGFMALYEDARKKIFGYLEKEVTRKAFF